MPALCQRLLANLLEQSPRYSFAGVIGLDGHIICAPGPLDPGLDYSDRPYFQRALQTGAFVIGEYAVSRGAKRPAIHMARPFRHRDGTVGGVVVVALDLDWLAQQLKRIDLPPGAIVSVMDRNGTILARVPGDARFIGQQIPPRNRFVLEGSKVGIAAMTSLEGDRALMVAYSPLGAGPRDLAVGVGFDRETTFAAVDRADRNGPLLVVAGAGFALALTYMAGVQLIRRPFDRLLRVADQWRTGDLAARSGLPADSSEFGRLGAAFDGMAAALDARERSLRTALESTTDSVLVIDRAWRITYLNENAKAQVSGGRDLLGWDLWEAFPQTVFSAFRRRLPNGDGQRPADAGGSLLPSVPAPFRGPRVSVAGWPDRLLPRRERGAPPGGGPAPERGAVSRHLRKCGGRHDAGRAGRHLAACQRHDVHHRRPQPRGTGRAKLPRLHPSRRPGHRPCSPERAAGGPDRDDRPGKALPAQGRDQRVDQRHGVAAAGWRRWPGAHHHRRRGHIRAETRRGGPAGKRDQAAARPRGSGFRRVGPGPGRRRGDLVGGGMAVTRTRSAARRRPRP